MAKTFQDIIKLDFEIKARGMKKLDKITKDMDELSRSLSKLQALGF